MHFRVARVAQHADHSSKCEQIGKAVRRDTGEQKVGLRTVVSRIEPRVVVGIQAAGAGSTVVPGVVIHESAPSAGKTATNALNGGSVSVPDWIVVQTEARARIDKNVADAENVGASGHAKFADDLAGGGGVVARLRPPSWAGQIRCWKK